MRTQPHEHALEPQPQQGTHAPVGKLGLQIANHTGDVDACVRNDDPRRLADHILRHIKHRHDDVLGIRDDQHGAEGLENPLEENPGVEVVKVIFLDDELNQLVAHDEGEDNARDGDNHRLREIANHVEDAAVLGGGRHADLPGDLAHLCVQGIKHPGQV